MPPEQEFTKKYPVMLAAYTQQAHNIESTLKYGQSFNVDNWLSFQR